MERGRDSEPRGRQCLKGGVAKKHREELKVMGALAWCSPEVVH